jgi:predicted DNA-binding transcriptional regulator AlpA
MSMTIAQAVKLSGRSESWLRRHDCSWCQQTLLNALRHGCGSIYEQCEPSEKDFSDAANVPRIKRCALAARAAEMTATSEHEKDKRAYAVREFCRAYGICRATFYTVLRNGRLRAVKIGSKTLVLIEDANTWASSLPKIIPRSSRG